MKISVIIPTRSRAEYLHYALTSALVARDRADCDVEIIVSDNQSDDDTAKVLSRFEPQGVRVLRTPERYSMRHNFEFALSAATGTHVVYIGDDDAVLPNGLRVLSRLILEHEPDIVKWRVLNYIWPDPAAGQPGWLRIRPTRLDGRLERIDPGGVLDGLARADFKSYQDGGMIYHGCVSRRLIDAAIAGSGGPYFWGSAPDVFTSLQALMVADTPMLRINLPITLGAASPRSNGSAWQKSAAAGTGVKGSEYALFIAESSTDPYQCRLPAKCQSLNMMVLDCLQTAAKVQGKALEIDLSLWQEKIALEIAGFAEPARSTSLDLAREVFGMQIALPPAPPSAAAGPLQASQNSISDGAGATLLRQRPTTLDYRGGEVMADCASVAAMLDQLVDLEHFQRPATGTLSALVRILQIHARARRVAG